MKYEIIKNAKAKADKFNSNRYVEFEIAPNEVKLAEVAVEYKRHSVIHWDRSAMVQAAQAVFFCISKGWRLFRANQRFPAVAEIAYFCDLTGCRKYKVSRSNPKGAVMSFYSEESDYYRHVARR